MRVETVYLVCSALFGLESASVFADNAGESGVADHTLSEITVTARGQWL
jgi:hypothetical protein